MFVTKPYHLLYRSLPILCLALGFNLAAIGQIGQTQKAKKPGSIFNITRIDSLPPGVQLKKMPTTLQAFKSAAASRQQSLPCNSATFYIHLAPPAGQTIQLNEVQTLPGGNFILGGTVTLANAEQEGLLCVIGEDGNIIFQTQLRVANRPVTISSLKVFLDGRVCIAGILHDGTDKVVAMQLNADLTTNWVKVLDCPATPLKVTCDLLDNQQIALAVQMPAAIGCIVMNTDGTVFWTQQLAVPGMNELVGFGQLIYEDLGVIINTTVAGRKETQIVTLKATDGVIRAASLFGNGTEQQQYSKTTSFYNLITAGVIKNEANQFQVIRQIMRTADYIETSHRYTIPGTVDFNTSVATDNAGDVIGVCQPTDGRLAFINQYAGNLTAPMSMRSYAVSGVSRIAGVARSLKDGGYLFGLNTTASNDVILVKTDSSGVLAGCGYTDLPLNYTEDPMTSRMTTAVPNLFNFSLANAASNTTASALNRTVNCNTIYCPGVPQDNLCLSSFYKTFRSYSYVDMFEAYALMRNNRHIMMTRRYERVLGNSNQLSYALKLFDDRGNFIKGYDVYTDGVSRPIMMRKIDDHHIIVISYNPQGGIPCYGFTLLDDDLQVIWTKSVKTFAGYNFNINFETLNVVRDAQGNFYFTGCSLGFNEPAKALVYKMNSTGDPLWVKTYQSAADLFLTCRPVVTASSVIVVIEGSFQSVTLRVDKQTGQFLNSYRYQNRSDGTIYTRLLELDGDRILYAGNDYNSRFVMGAFDTTGRPISMKIIDHQGSEMRAATTKEGKLYGMYEYWNAGTWKNVILKADRDLNIEFSNVYDPIDGYPKDMQIAENGSIYAAGNTGSNYGSGDFDPFLQKFEENGTIGTCTFQPVNLPLIDLALNTTSAVMPVADRTFTPINMMITLIPNSDAPQVNGMPCSSVPLCNEIKVEGDNSVCNFTDVYTYTGKRNPECNILPVWIIDTSFATIQSVGEGTVDLKFRKTGTTRVIARLNIGCEVIKDTLLVDIQDNTDHFTLGNDRLLCTGDSLLLEAGTGYHSYLWQDGSNQDHFMVRAPGDYEVTVENVCGDLKTGKVKIMEAVKPPLDIGNNTNLCIGDTLRVKASAGFSLYEWKFGSFSNNTGDYIEITGRENMTVTLTATTSQGCKAADTLYITSIQPRPVFLGNDLSFCVFDSARLFAGTGYVEYNWNNGSHSNAIIIKQAGIYWVQAKDVNGCIARDTLLVPSLFPLPQFNLGKDFNVCAGQSVQLDPGPFSQYTWQNGSTNRYQTINIPGKYWVTVSDQHFCKAADTILINTIVQPPADFLLPVDSICQYDQATLKASGTFSKYWWSTGSTQPAISVQKAGNYVLDVEDAQGCKGSDTVNVIEKTCYTGVFVPNAFTPGGDNLNDKFLARVYGHPVQFRLTVYNRWGEIVFDTKDPTRGWDGKVGGLTQDTGVFVWQCVYQYQGEAKKYEKGKVILIR